MVCIHGMQDDLFIQATAHNLVYVAKRCAVDSFFGPPQATQMTALVNIWVCPLYAGDIYQ